ncbi:MAG: peptide-binding protein, partial [Candidatus Omnitrophica bacterium]|nr:peptide-binding protein [Candidatus Omnitrophota bacterium]
MRQSPAASPPVLSLSARSGDARFSCRGILRRAFDHPLFLWVRSRRGTRIIFFLARIFHLPGEISGLVFFRCALAALLSGCVALSGCRTESPPLDDAAIISDAPSYGDAIVEAGIGDARTLLPLLASDSASGQICNLLYNGLVKYDKDLNLVGDLAQRWEILDGGLTIIFYLRRNVRWHDGAPFTAADVEFTYRKLIDPNVRTPYSGDFEKVRSFSVLDPYTLRIAYKEPFVPALASWGMNILPRHILEHEDLNFTRRARQPIGTGPYKFKSWKTQELIVLEANPDYFEGRPYLNRYYYRIIPDPATMFLELEGRGIDMMGLSSLQYARQTETPFFRREYQKFRYQGFFYTYVGFNLQDEKFQDVRVRQAINCAVDKQELIGGVLQGLGSVCTGPFPPRSWAYNPTVAAAAYDPRKALELLAAAGWRQNPQGVLEKDGRPFAFTIVTNQGNDERKQAAEIMQRRLGGIGMQVKIKVIEWSAFINEFLNKRKFEAILLGWSLSLDPDVYDIWHSSKTREGEFNFVGYSNADVDRLLEAARQEFDQEKRKQMYHRVHEIIYAEQPYLFLYTPDSLPAV